MPRGNRSPRSWKKKVYLFFRNNCTLFGFRIYGFARITSLFFFSFASASGWRVFPRARRVIDSTTSGSNDRFLPTVMHLATEAQSNASDTCLPVHETELRVVYREISLSERSGERERAPHSGAPVQALAAANYDVDISIGGIA